MDPGRRVDLLTTDEPGPVREVVDDLLVHGSPADWDRLIAGFAIESGTVQQTGRPGPLRCPDPSQVPARRLTVAALIAAAPAGTAAAARRPGITELSVAGRRLYDAYYRPASATDSAVDVTALAGLPALRRLSVEHADTLHGLDAVVAADRLMSLRLKNVVLAELDLTPLTGLTTLRLNEMTGFRRLRGLPPSLVDLTLHDVPAAAVVELGAATGLEQVTVIRGPLPGPTGALSRLRRLEYHTTSSDQDGVRAWLPALTSVESAVLYGLDDVEALAAMTGLRRLNLGYGRRPAGLAALRLPNLETLTLEWIDDLTSLDGLVAGALPRLRTITVKGTQDLVSVDGLPAAAGLTTVELAGSGVRDIGALAALPRLETLRLRTPALTDLTPLANLARLRDLDLSGCHQVRDLTPLAGLALDRLVLSQTRVTRAAIPAGLHPVVHPPSLVAPRAARAAGRPAPVPPPGAAAQSTFARLRGLLLASEPAHARQGLELLRTLGDAALFEAFLSGCEPATRPTAAVYGQAARVWTGTRVGADLPRSCDVVRPNRLLGQRLPRRNREAAIHALVAYAGAGSPTAHRLREALRSVVVDGRGSDRREHPVDLRALAELPRLEHLGVIGASELVGGPALARAARLRTLVVRSEHRLDLREVAAPSVATLVVYGALIDGLELDGFPGARALFAHSYGEIGRVGGRLPALVDATLVGRGVGPLLTSLARSPLERLTVTFYQGPSSALAALAHTPSLTELELRHSALPDLDGVLALRSLRALTVHMVETEPLGALARLPRLERLSLAGARLSTEDLAALAEAPALTELRLVDAVRIPGRLPDRLERVCRLGPEPGTHHGRFGRHRR